jgi:hypothetical protein
MRSKTRAQRAEWPTCGGHTSAKHWMREIMDFFGEITDP